MRKNLARFYKAWELRQHGRKLHEIVKIMSFKSEENTR